jgi:hypothetical protein
VEAAEQAYANLDYAEANKLADRAVKQRGLTHDQLVRAYRILALTYASLDKEQQSKDAFVLVLAFDPEYQADPNLGPKVQGPFFEAKGFWRAQAAKPGIEATPIVRPKEAGSLRVVTRDPLRLVKKLNVGYRWGAAGEMTVKSQGPADIVNVDVPEGPSGVTRFDYFAQGLDERDNVVFEAGSATSPKTTAVEPERTASTGSQAQEGKSIFASPWFWTAVGVVVVGAVATGTYFAVRPAPQEVFLPPTRAAFSPQLICGSGQLCR